MKVGGAYASQHALGEAADIVPPYKQRQTHYTLKAWFDWLKDHTDFDQLILEHDSKGSYWIHVSCRRNRKANRHQVFYDLKKKPDFVFSNTFTIWRSSSSEAGSYQGRSLSAISPF